MSNSSRWYDFHGINDVPSPSLIIFRERIRENIRRMIATAGSVDRLRPHIKTHKMPAVMRLQIAAGITRFKCATLAETEMAASCGDLDLLLAAQLVGPNVERYLRLLERFPSVRFSSLVDDLSAAERLSSAAVAANRVVDVWIDLDCGQHRTGIISGVPALELYDRLARLPGIRFRGLHAYDGHLHQTDRAEREAACESAIAPVLELRAKIESSLGAPIELVVGGTPTFPFHARRESVQCSPGTPILWDAGYSTKIPDMDFEVAAALLTRVVSKPGDVRLCLDLGHKAVASEGPHPRVVFPDLPDAIAVAHNEEHLVIETAHASRYATGSEIIGIPWHICPTVALYSQAFVVEDQRVLGTWAVSARERLLTTERAAPALA